MTCIYCYSGTGNSLFAAAQIAKAMNANVLPMTNSTKICDDDVIGFVFPTYFWVLPKTVERFVKEMEINKKNPYIFAVITHGDTTIHGVIGVLEKLLREKGVKISYGCYLKSVQNYVPRYEVNDTLELREQYNESLEKITNDITQKVQKKFSRATFLNTFVSRSFPAKNSDCDKFFTASNFCAGCGRCRDICPADNIRIEDGKPVFLHHCEHCISCVHACDLGALDWKNGAAKHGRYRHPNVTYQDLMAISGRHSPK